jgi:hypothetical protein
VDSPASEEQAMRTDQHTNVMSEDEPEVEGMAMGLELHPLAALDPAAPGAVTADKKGGKSGNGGKGGKVETYLTYELTNCLISG